MQRLKYESSVAIGPYHSQPVIFLNFRIMCKTKEELYMAISVRVCVCVCVGGGKRWGFHTDEVVYMQYIRCPLYKVRIGNFHIKTFSRGHQN